MPSRRCRSVASLTVRQPQRLLRNPHNVRRQHHAARVSRPMRYIQAGIVFRQVRIAAIAKDALHEIQIAHQAARRDEPDLHGLRRLRPAAGQTSGRSSSETKQRAISS